GFVLSDSDFTLAEKHCRDEEHHPSWFESFTLFRLVFHDWDGSDALVSTSAGAPWGPRSERAGSDPPRVGRFPFVCGADFSSLVCASPGDELDMDAQDCGG